jgi:GT2 family glycosyltransferase
MGAMAEAPGPIARALKALPGPEKHLHRLAEQALALTRAGDAAAAFLLADRLCRVMRPVNADALALRATIAQLLGDAALMRADIAAAVALTPRHGVANLLAMRFAPPPEKHAAALRLITADTGSGEPGGAHPPPAHLPFALDTLLASGAPLVAALAATPAAVVGWAAWPEASEAQLTIDWATGHGDGRLQIGSTTLRLFADPAHPLAGEGRQAARVHLPWPDGAAGGTAHVLAADPERSGHSADAGADREPVQAGAAKPDAPAASPAIIANARLVRPTAGALAAGTAPKPSPPAAPPPTPVQVAVIVPVHGDGPATRACLAMLLDDTSSSPPRRVVVVDDASPDPQIRALVDDLAAAGAVTLVRNPLNLGFAASVNRALATLAPDEDALLLNADALMPPGALARLLAAAYAGADIGTVTPLSNNGEYTSVPARFRANPLPSPDAVMRLDDAAARANGDETIGLPNGIGFCLYLRRDALAAAGGALSLDFGRGYCEDVDLCLRMAKAGYRHVCAAGVYVGHAGASSFGAEKRALVVANLDRLKARYPAYARASAAFVRADPLREAAARLRAVALAGGPAFTLAIGPERATRAEPTAEPWADGPCERATARLTRDGLELALHDDADADGVDAGAATLVLCHPLASARDGLAADLAALPLARIVLVDPQDLPKVALDAVLATRTPFDVIATRPGLACAQAGLVRRRDLARPCCNGLCPREASSGRDVLNACGRQRDLLPGAGAIRASTPALAQWLARTLPPGLVITGPPGVIGSEPPRHALSRPPARRIALIPEGGDRIEQLAIIALATQLRAALGATGGNALEAIEIVVLGDAADDGALAASGVFVTGPMDAGERLAWLERAGGAHLVLLSRDGLLGDAALQRLASAGWPTAAFRWPGEAAAMENGPSLWLPAELRIKEVASRIARWIAGRDESLHREQRAAVQPQAVQ